MEKLTLLYIYGKMVLFMKGVLIVRPWLKFRIPVL